MRHIFLFLITALGVYHSSSAQSGFQRTYGSGSEKGFAVLPVSDGYLLAGSTFDSLTDQNAVILKTDLTGNPVWAKEYGGTYLETASSLCATSDGGFVAAGVTWTYTGPALTDWSNIFLFKIDSAGNTMWSRSINRGVLDEARSVRETADKGFILCGFTGTSPGDRDLLLIKTDSVGNTQWTQVFGTSGPSYEEGYGAIELRGGGFAAVGVTTGFSALNDTSAYVVITNTAGTGMYTRHYNLTTPQQTNKTYGYDIIQDSNGRLVIAGRSGGEFTPFIQSYVPFLLQTDSTGVYINYRSYQLNTGHGGFSSVKEDLNGGYIAGGTMGNNYPLLTRTNYGLDKLWCFYYGNFTGPAILGQGRSVLQNNDGSYILLGDRLNWPTPSATQMYLIKTDSTGNSGCFQAVPPFLGTAAYTAHTLISGTVFSVQGGSEFDPQSVAIPSALSDSILCGPTGLDEITGGKCISVYPNPARTLINVSRSKNENPDGTIRLLNILGSTLTDQIRFNDSFQLTLDVSSLPQGIYFIEYLEKSLIKERIKLIVAY